MTRARKRHRRPPIAPAPDLAQLTTLWRSQADSYERDGVSGHATLIRRLAGELEAVLATRDHEPLTLAAASRESGYSVAHLRRLVSMQVIPNVGHNEVRVARGSLPRKPRAQRLGPDLTTELLGLPGARP